MAARKKRIRRYAEGTTVAVEQTRIEIEQMLLKHGATGFMNGYSQSQGAMIICEMDGLRLKFDIPMPTEADVKSPGRRTAAQLKGAMDREWKRRWRALHLIVKAKLEVTATGERTLEHEFMADVLLPDNITTVGQAIAGKLRLAAAGGELPGLLQLGSGK